MSKKQPSKYKNTVILPDTSFPMKGDLVNREPARLEKWESEGLYERIIKTRQESNAPKYILHDGPPFANGDVHMGTALNKVLKDFVVKSKSMAGFEVPYIPGWDCHGLPIEFKVVEKAKDLEPAEIRRRCTEFAKGWINTQRESFRRLGVLGDWWNPYLTLDPQYEASVIRLFGKLVEKNAIYQSLKPVQWSFGAKTALAEAELDYKDKVSPAIYVQFELTAPEKVNLPTGASMVIWTTTPWTLPSNLGVCVHPRFVYSVGAFENEEGKKATLVIARDLIDQFSEKTGFKPVGELQEIEGSALEGLEARHPLADLNRTSKLILGEFVTADAGTGAVHIAPGHGSDDYMVGQQYKLGVLSPVDDDGCYTEEVGIDALVGQHVFKGNAPIMTLLAESGHLLGEEKYEHSYPHCWRSKKPIIFRAVSQFFISLDGLREKALSEIDQTQWLPKWGRNRIYGTVESRPDWCISRQRTWGVPLPVFFDENNEAVVTTEIVEKVAKLVEAEGTNVWFELSDEELTAKLGLPSTYKKGKDTLDVWIDSGSSHTAVLENHSELHAPADLYLEATDQHRGWFQSSLMMSIAARDKAPYKTVMTHGFVVDKDKKKISKSDAAKKGKPTDAAYFYGKYGADILRLWVSSVDWQTEVPFSEDIFAQVGEPYRRLRNTFKILLGNLGDFNSEEHTVDSKDFTLADRWMMERLQELVVTCTEAYSQFEFRKVFSAINNFTTNELSAVYIDQTKDRMYCDGVDSLRRRATQTVIHEVFETLVRLLAPILAYTSDEAWQHAGYNGSVHTETFPEPQSAFMGDQATASPIVADLLELKSKFQTAIEEQIKAGQFKKNNEAHITVTLPSNYPHLELLKDEEFGKEFFILAQLDVLEGEAISVEAKRTEYQMCPRCRRYEPIQPGREICDRCYDIVGEVAEPDFVE